MIYITLFIEFFKIGLFAIGGGPATIPFLMDLMEKYHWYTKEEFTNLIAISESTPGPVGVNMATYSGYHAAGILGAVVATISLVFPSVVIIILVAKFLSNVDKNKTVQAVFQGIRPAVTGLIATSALGIIKIALVQTVDGTSILRMKTLIMFIIVFLLMQIKKFSQLHPAIWLLFAAIAGIILM